MTVVVLTGAPGVGKTTAVISVTRKLQVRGGVKVGGIVSKELRDNNNMRIGLYENKIDVYQGRDQEQNYYQS